MSADDSGIIYKTKYLDFGSSHLKIYLGITTTYAQFSTDLITT